MAHPVQFEEKQIIKATKNVEMMSNKRGREKDERYKIPKKNGKITHFSITTLLFCV